MAAPTIIVGTAATTATIAATMTVVTMIVAMTAATVVVGPGRPGATATTTAVRALPRPGETSTTGNPQGTTVILAMIMIIHMNVVDPTIAIAGVTTKWRTGRAGAAGATGTAKVAAGDLDQVRE